LPADFWLFFDKGPAVIRLPAWPASARKVPVDRHMAGLEAPRHADAIGDRRKIEAPAEASAPGALAVYR
jgi:hypothetical protein